MKVKVKSEREWRLLRVEQRRLPSRIRFEFDANLAILLGLLRRQLVSTRRSAAIRRPVSRRGGSRGPR